ncbi:protein-glutamate O-methyltransferase CheR [Cohnella endophytica]|uniref:Protein-glutamate O-methyltransferase CheR n=1 Tax=Cohnella endophytica TaxID=2419778 RepID=A0A494XE10_9BACL|nr:protein-glutamate O-methyltransferase CheR [Cohnella endophytica]RKP45843.1 protein-glutamate O-methyltransferase CheR [Cohnella endophytica]
MSLQQATDGDLEKIEIALLLEGIFRRYGYDFRNYSYASVRRRIWHRIHLEGLNNVSSLQERVLHQPEAFGRLLGDMVIPVTEMFRDPAMFRAFREDVVPLLRQLPNLRIWHAGCSTGEEVHAVAIILHEEGLLDKTRIYATDINESALQQAKDGIIPIERMKQYTKNYHAAGGIQSFSDYYDSDHGVVILKPYLRNNVVFARHNLVTDRSFNEFHVILCRNVMIYFNSQLRDQVHRLFYESLANEGFLVVGDKESIAFTPKADKYDTWNEQYRLYRKMR